MSLKNTLAGWLVRYAPELIYYRARPASRSGLKVRRSGSILEICRPADRRLIRISTANAVYVVDMVEFFDFYFGAVASTSENISDSTWEVVDFSNRRKQRINGFSDFEVVTPSMAEPFATIQQYLTFADLKPGDVAIDLGGYSGLTGIAFSKVVGSVGKVVVVEPDPLNHEAAAANIATNAAVNGLANIELIQAAAGPSAGFMDLSSEGSMGSSAVAVVGDYRGNVVRVPTYPLEDIARMGGLERVDFIKIDIEGSEEPVLRASENFLRRYRPRLIIEPHVVQGVRSDGPLTGLLESFGYVCRTVDQEGSSLPLVEAVPR